MSLILDALRKMEQERKASRRHSTDIRPEVLSYRGVPRKTSRSPLVLPVTAVVIISCIAGGLLMMREKTPSEAPALKTSSKTVPIKPIQPTPAIPQPQVTVAPPPAHPRPAPDTAQPTKPSAPQREETIAPGSNTATASGITISGIAYQDDRSMRRAVINGALVGEGAEVAGAKVVEIRENRVRFSRAGENFEVLQSSAFTQH
ncbi:general secretion pathway protein GspB [Geobacter pelophilus]|uniref:General secretion pathway protein GspB n=1 Tax=Geoanaerobacter pelophilus TaxID=60036 RepID=A0AAW4L5P8_9BACT|nr:general secretion pathway protein GspB [Geoanaerobacter pelophilus]MBT0665492.1 general secretion pathway protein GspB [Geoanaerobacter pelophilus]